MNKIILKLLLAVFAVFLVFPEKEARTAEIDDRQAMEIFQKMNRFLAGAKQFSVTLESSYDAPQQDGQMVEYGAIRNIQIKRPDKLRVDKQRSDGEKSILVFDGKQILVHNVDENIYAMAEKADTVDEAVKYLVSVLKKPLPLARLFRTSLPEEMDRLVEEIDYVELNMLTDPPTDHLAVRTRDIDFQIWITRGKEPLPKRIVMTYRNFRGSPQFRADFSNWDITTKSVRGPFAYNPPKNAEQVPMLVRNRQGGAQ